MKNMVEKPGGGSAYNANRIEKNDSIFSMFPKSITIPKHIMI